MTIQIAYVQPFVVFSKRYIDIFYINNDIDSKFTLNKVPYTNLYYNNIKLDNILFIHDFEHIHTECSDPKKRINDLPEEFRERAKRYSPHYQGLICKKCGCCIKGSLITDNNNAVTGIYLSDSGYSFDDLYMINFVPPSCSERFTKEMYIMDQALE